MPEFGAVAAFTAVSFALIVIPGPSVMFERLGAAGGAAMIGLGIQLAITGRKD